MLSGLIGLRGECGAGPGCDGNEPVGDRVAGIYRFILDL